MRKSFFPSFVLSWLLLLLLVAVTQLGFAQVRSSTNYQLQSDSINVGGGFSSSTNYSQESTFGEVATGDSGSATYQLRAGYQQMQEVFLSMSVPADVTMSPSLPGITGGTSNGSTSVVVTTDSPAGYQLTIEAANSPAMQSGVNSILDHSTLITKDFTLPTATTSFGFSVYGNDASLDFYNDGAFCGSGTNFIQECWRGLTITPFIISQGAGSNHPSGATTTLYFRVGINSGANVVSGLYTATSTLTALPL
jgi:hypothetical protein